MKIKYFSKNICFLRENRNMTQKQFADVIGVDQATISRWEDPNRKPTLDTAIEASEKLNVPLDIILFSDISCMEETSIDEVIKEVKLAIASKKINEKDEKKLEYLKSTLKMLEDK